MIENYSITITITMVYWKSIGKNAQVFNVARQLPIPSIYIPYLEREPQMVCSEVVHLNSIVDQYFD